MPKKLDVAEQLRRTVQDAIGPKKYSYFTLGAAAGVNPAIINRFAHQRDITLSTAAKLCKALDLELVRCGD